MKKKILFTASIPQHIKAFHLPYLQWFQEQGYETHVATNEFMDLPFVDKHWVVPIQRSPYSYKNIKAFKELKEIIEREDFALINCHTPTASILTRLAAKNARRKGTKIIYTAHGFHFYAGGPTLYWYVFYPLEKYMTKFADAVITINHEDYAIIKKNGNKKTDYYIVPGIGVNKRDFSEVTTQEKIKLRHQKGFPNDTIILIYAAEFIERKNHDFIIDAVQLFPSVFENVIVFFAGKGELEQQLRNKIIKLGLNDKFSFLGFRKDIADIFKLADIAISSSRQEGLPINIIEAMMCGLPIVASVDRGHKELIKEGVNGYLYPQNDHELFVKGIQKLSESIDLREQFSKNSIQMAEKYELSNSLRAITDIYKKYLEE